MDIRVVRLTAANTGLLDRVADDVFDEDIVAERLAAYLAHGTNLMFLAVAGDLVVGQVAAVIHRHPDQPTELYVDNLGVAPAFQRQGIARALVEAMFHLGRELGCEESWVATEPDNQPARRLYESLGSDGRTCVVFEYELQGRGRPMTKA